MERPMGQKAAKRKGKASKIPNATQDAKNKRAIIMDRLAQAKEDELELRVVQMMMKDTSTMNDNQRDIHEKYYNYDQEFWELVEEEFMDDSDEEQQLQNERRSGSSSRPKRRTTVDRGREEGHNRLFNDYFSENPVYTDVQFRRRFRMHRHVFLRIVDALGNHDEYFQMRVDATGKMGLSQLQKCTSVIRMLAYGSHADLVDEYVRIGESTSIECLERFVKGVNVVFGAEYLRKPNNTDVEHLLQMGESRGFPGSNNDINVLNQSNVFNDILEGRAPNGEKKKLFAQHQESARKDVERAFGVLQSRFAIIRGPARAWHMDTLKHTIYACIILHNMIVEDERHTYGGNFDYSYDNVDINNSTTETFSGPHPNLATRLQRRASIQEKQVHRKL
ncbi:uncharacterized protein LOC127131963 [Lathyrus oleraceus]|uniref:uncharacterized protein LOC127131963 n=1 Tax=Pisum sativum TaxID=3888 RepID=UPI0021D26F78|nr:uncharacterized protein LOC127131963 [Pisum sativum]